MSDRNPRMLQTDKGTEFLKSDVSTHASHQRHTLVQHRKQRHKSERRRTFQSHSEDQDVAIDVCLSQTPVISRLFHIQMFHQQKLTTLHRRAAETGRFVQRVVPPFDRHVAE